MRILIAARLSQTADGQTGLDTQDTLSSAWARENGHEVVHIAADHVSGRKALWSRKNLRPWVTDSRKIAQYDAVLGYRFDRLSRGNDEETSAIESWAREHGKKLITVDGLVYPCEGAEGIRWDVTKRIAHEEWLKTSERYRRMQGHLRSDGYLVGRNPYGYRIGQKGDHKTLVPDPVEAKLIQDAAAHYLAGNSLQKTCAWLDAAGRVPRAGGRWSPVSLNQIFRNPVLEGRRVNAKGHTILRVDPILDKPTWHRLQGELSRKAARTGIAPKQTAYLTSVIRCPDCDSPMYRIHNRYYRCHGNDRQPSRCANLVTITEADAWTDKLMLANTGPVTELTVIPATGNADEIAAVEHDIRELDLDDPAYDTRLATLRAQRARLKAAPGQPSRVEETVAPYTLGDMWRRLSQPERRRYLLDAKVSVYAARGQFWLAGDPGRIAFEGWG